MPCTTRQASILWVSQPKLIICQPESSPGNPYDGLQISQLKSFAGMRWVGLLLTHLDPKFRKGRSLRHSIKRSVYVGLALSQACLNTAFRTGAAICHRLLSEWPFRRIATAFEMLIETVSKLTSNILCAPLTASLVTVLNPV